PLRLQKYFVYILQSESDSGYYIGFTSSLERRIWEHNSGKTRSLKHRRPLRLVYFEEYSSKSEAKAREQQIKSWKGGAAFRQLLDASSPRC
ncbi:MAG: GIY-YIG nuclease family protein, partial [Candidatus Neomarinimicrobiota bacterium]